MTDAIVATAADIAEARAHAVNAIVAVLWAIACVKARYDRAIVSVRGAAQGYRVAFVVLRLQATAFTRATCEIWSERATSDIARAIVTRGRRDVVELAVGAAAVPAIGVAVVALLVFREVAITAHWYGSTDPVVVTVGPRRVAISIGVTHPIVTLSLAGVSEACAHTVHTFFFTILWSIARLKGGVLPAFAAVRGARRARRIGLGAAALIGAARKLLFGLGTAYVARPFIARCGRNVVELALRAAAIAAFLISVVAGFAAIHGAISTFVMMAVRVPRPVSAPATELLCGARHITCASLIAR